MSDETRGVPTGDARAYLSLMIKDEETLPDLQRLLLQTELRQNPLDLVDQLAEIALALLLTAAADRGLTPRVALRAIALSAEGATFDTGDDVEAQEDD